MQGSPFAPAKCYIRGSPEYPHPANLLSTRLTLNALTALIYAALGWLSLKISVPPDYVSVVFLPAGLALAVVLIWGSWLAPGIFLGSLLVQVLAHEQIDATFWQWSTVVPGLGATAQAVLTAWMVRRWVHYPASIDTPRRVVMLLFVTTPLGSAFNATLSVPTLVLEGILPANEALYSWWSWWLGDSLGVILFTPLMLALFGEPAEAWRPRVRTVALPMSLALAVAGTSYYQLRVSDERGMHQQFEQKSAELAGRLQRRLDAQTDGVASIAKLLELGNSLTERDFRTATQPWLERYPGTQNFGWSPKVTREQRAEFEAEQSQKWRDTFVIKGRDSNGRVFPALPADDHLPIALVEPLASNRSVLGLDVSVLPATMAAVKTSRETQAAAVTQGIRLVQESGEQRGVIMYQAVYTHAEQDAEFKGVVSAVFRMDDVLNAVLGDVPPGQLSICLVDVDADPKNNRLSGPEDCQNRHQGAHGLHVDMPIVFGNRNWSLHFVAGPEYQGQQRNWTAWATMSTGLVAVALLGAFLMVISGHSRRTQQLVELRTHELARTNATLVQLAHFDPLTGLANRAHWMSQAEAALASAQQTGEQLAVMFLDLDRFKHVNDSLGHNQGDQLLKTVAQRLKQCLRARDVLARLGGDEFVVLLPRVKGKEGAAVGADKIVKALSMPVALDPHEVTVSASLGVAFYPDDGQDVETLLRHADTAMYSIKDAGRNGWRFFSSDMTEHLSHRLMLESGLRRAIQNNIGHELRLEYQPQVDGRTGQVTGLEALVRWQHPTLGLIGPDQFIPVAEDSGLIEPLGQWIQQQACKQLASWQHAHPDVPALFALRLAINISALEFNRPGFVKHLSQCIEQSGLKPEQLELEITESLLMQAQPVLIERLGQINDMGVTLSLDDFGTGYSSLGYLKRLPLSKLKIDRSFVTDVPGDVEDEAIVRATLSMAHDLGLQVVAEGVETTEQLAFLQQHGCDALQGWLFSRALRAESVPDWLRQHHGHNART
jgi:diguanylate cyclase (GGDEF)-like protein